MGGRPPFFFAKGRAAYRVRLRLRRPAPADPRDVQRCRDLAWEYGGLGNLTAVNVADGVEYSPLGDSVEVSFDVRNRTATVQRGRAPALAGLQATNS